MARGERDAVLRGAMITILVALDDRILASAVADPLARCLLDLLYGSDPASSPPGTSPMRSARRTTTRGKPRPMQQSGRAGRADVDACGDPPGPDQAGTLWLLGDGSLGLVAVDGLDLSYWRSGDGGQTWQALFLIGDACCGTVTVPFGAEVVNVRRVADDAEGFSADVRVASLTEKRPWLRSIATLPGFDALSLTVVGDEMLLAGHLVARSDLLPEVIRPVLYVSRDARTWTEVAQPSSWGDLSILRLTLGARALVALLGESDLGPPVDVLDALWVAPAR